ncbi:hypothetical protein [Nonomuraea sp. GTA35]|uniref:hypothetical protein n=1 Tax=Nonomuraea sp. GTA35 TaxID=1676746 RepID=UPI0035C1D70A
MRDLEIRPATSWDDVRMVFGPQGAYSGCWCMWFRLTGPEFRATPPDGRRERLQRLVDGAERAPGVLAYLSGTPVGWCAVAPREEHARLLRSRVARPASQGARVVEGYPKDSEKRLPADELYHGWRSLFEEAGFEEVERRSPTRPIMRVTTA